MRSLCAVALSALLPLTALAQSAEDEAGDVAEVDKDARGPLRERVRPVSGARLSMGKRFDKMIIQKSVPDGVRHNRHRHG